MSSRDTAHRNNYHDLLGLHHSMLLRRRLRGVGVDSTDWHGHVATLLAAWPQRLADQRVLRESLPTVQPLAETVGDLYSALFRDRPHLRNLFPESLQAQQERFAWSLIRLIDDMDKPDVLIPIFAELGRAHRKLGVRTVHYGPFGSAFLEALRGRAGAAWRPEYEAAWLRAYGFISDVMSSAAQSDIYTPPYVRATVVHHTLRRPDLAVLRVQPAQPYPFVAGQYATVESPRLPHAWRSYSIASAPGENEPLEFHVRATGTGRLSDVLVHHTRVGDVLRLAPARGTVTLAPPSERGVLLAAGGTGLATVKALLTEVARRPDPPATWLFFGARTREDLYEQEELSRCAGRYLWLRVVFAVSHGDAYPYEAGTVVDAVARRGNWAGYDAYLSGPRGMVEALRDLLVTLGIELDRIRYDPQ
ncbi:MAG: globin domain-containing protein [Micromonosporaceae bacterium]